MKDTNTMYGFIWTIKIWSMELALLSSPFSVPDYRQPVRFDNVDHLDS